jgi:hypothetical protein
MSNERNYQPIGHAPFLPRGGLLADLSTNELGIALGTEIRDNRGNVFRYIKASEALVEGDVVTQVAEAAWDSGILVDGALAAGATKVHIDTISTDAVANAYAGYYIAQACAASKGKAYRIKSHDAFSAGVDADLYMSDPLSEAFANDVALRIFNPFLYEKVDADTEVIKGVAIGAITADYFGWVQVAGFFQAIKCGHSASAAVVLDEPLIPVAANAGAVQGYSGNTEANILTVGASGLFALRAVAANTPCFITGYSKGIL